MDESQVEQSRRPDVVVITGMSGAGRTQVAKVLEDLDFFVIDNLPPPLLGRVVELAFGPGSSVTQLALVADVRGREFFGDLDGALHDLEQGLEANVRLVFLEADDDTLVRRFTETRRRHPAAEDGDGIIGGIRRERELLVDLRGRADLIIDTSATNVHQLRDRITGLLGDAEQAAMRIKVVSFGFKHGTPNDAEVVMDVRFLPNPHWDDRLRPFTGKDEPVREFVLGHPGTGPFIERFRSLLDVLVPGYVAEGKRYLTIAIGCTGGKHRSVAISDEIGAYLGGSTDVPVRVEHRDMGKE